jgi:hypothetical protein
VPFEHLPLQIWGSALLAELVDHKQGKQYCVQKQKDGYSSSHVYEVRVLDELTNQYSLAVLVDLVNCIR